MIKGVTLTKKSSEASYDSKSSTLYLKDAMIVDTSSGTALSSSINGLTIVARGTVFIVSRATIGIGIQLTSPSEIRGVSSSTLNVGGSVGIMLSSSLSISAPKMQVAGDSYGIGGISYWAPLHERPIQAPCLLKANQPLLRLKVNWAALST